MVTPFHPSRSHKITICTMSSTMQTRMNKRQRYHFKANTNRLVTAAVRTLRRIAFVPGNDAGMRGNKWMYLGIWNKGGVDPNLDRNSLSRHVIFTKIFRQNNRYIWIVDIWIKINYSSHQRQERF